FPPAARWGHPGWGDVVSHMGEAWQKPEEREKLLASANQITEALQKYASHAPEPLEGSPAWLDEGFKAFAAAYDPQHGGFGSAPKFPMPVYHNFLLRYYA